jgi:hypothetical protein
VAPGQWPDPIEPMRLANMCFEEFYTFVRVLPYDDFASISDDAIDFKLIYDNVFRYYRLILPAMNKRLNMGDPDIWCRPTAARYLLRTTDLAIWDTPAYMPRTRDLSSPRRALLQRFCRRVLAEHGIRAEQDASVRAVTSAQR